MTATVTITTARREDALRVPLRALRFRPETDGEAASPPAQVAAGRPAQDGAGVFVLDGDGELRRVELRTGLRDERFAEVVEGDLAPGAAVAVAYRRPLEKDEPARSPVHAARAGDDGRRAAPDRGARPLARLRAGRDAGGGAPGRRRSRSRAASWSR